MDTPICDFVNEYSNSVAVRAHMPGHKGKTVLGPEALDITEVHGADSLYEADGIIAASERNASALFGTQATFYSAEGSSLCIRAMLALCLQRNASSGRRTVVAARNAHKALLYTAALLDLDIVWLWPEEEEHSLCRCIVSAAQLERVLSSLSVSPIAVYVTSPDYLGGEQDIAALAEVSHRYGVPLAVDNAHGAYLHFLSPSRHPMDLGADLCCDSAHKTLPVLTGGAYLHIAENADPFYVENAKRALSLFGSTSPSYLILQSLDAANRYLSEGFSEALINFSAKVDILKRKLAETGWRIEKSDPWKLTVHAAEVCYSGKELADLLRRHGIECEFADMSHCVLMLAPGNTSKEFALLLQAFSGIPLREPISSEVSSLRPPEQVCSIREAIFSPSEEIPSTQSAGRILAAPTVSCPPAIPLVVSGERIGEDALPLFRRYGIDTVCVIR